MLKAHFINVGKGCCTAIEFGSGRLGVIDVDDSRTFSDQAAEALAERFGMDTLIRYKAYQQMRDRSAATELVESAYHKAGRELTDPVDYIVNTLKRSSTFRFILTHPDMDHMSGIRRLNESAPFENLWDTDNDKVIDPNSWGFGGWRKEDWDAYQELRKRESNPKTLRLLRGCTGKYWDEDRIELLSPTQELVDKANETEEYNHLSYVLKISHGDPPASIIMGGDATYEAWDDILKDCGDHTLKCDVLFASHHGSKGNFHKEAVEAMSPSLVIVSVARGTDYAYQQYKRIANTVLSTKWRGNIEVTIDDWGQVQPKTQYGE
jgi:competence protein ComEC